MVKTVRLSKLLFFFFKTFILEAIEKQKLLNEEDYILFIDSTSIKVSPDAPEGRKLIESIYSKNNNYLLMDRAYENDKTLALTKNHRFKTVVPPKKKS